MATRYLRQALYIAMLVAGTSALVWVMAGAGLQIPPIHVWLFAIASFLFVWHFGVTAPALGLVSLERVVQFGFLLSFDPIVAAMMNAAAALVYPFTNARYRQGSLKVGALRALHNASMTALMLITAGAVYWACGGRHPLTELGLSDLFPLAAAAIAAQVVNHAMLVVFYRLDGRDPSRIFTPMYAFGDLLFVPGGILAALIYAIAPLPVFCLFVAVIGFFVLTFNASARSQNSLQAQLGAIATATRAGAALTGARRVDEVAERILEKSRALLAFDEFYLVLVDSDRNELDFRVHERLGERLPRRRKALSTGLFGWVIDQSRNVLIEDCAKLPAEIRRVAEATDKSTGSLLAVPLLYEGHAVGMISAQHTQPGIFAEPDLNLLCWLAEQAAGALADSRAFEQLDEYRLHLEERVNERTAELATADREREILLIDLRAKSADLDRLSREDPLTGLANRRDFSQRLATEIARAGRSGEPLAVALLDFDHFKRVNDGCGHAIGDLVLREFAGLLRQQCRSLDVIARYGGEEFALVLPNADLGAARIVCERIRVEVADFPWHSLHPKLRVTVSAGIAIWHPSITADTLLALADSRLYAAKNAGRNRVVV